MDTLGASLKKHLVRGIFMGMFAILLFRTGGADAAALTQNCGQWNVVPSPGSGRLNSVAAITPNDVWAVGSGSATPLIEHWNGSQWSLVSSPTIYPIITLNGVAAISSNDVWAVGYFLNPNTNGYQTLTEHWDGTRWSIIPSPNPQENPPSLGGVVAITSNDVWAVGGAGYYPNTAALTEHWNGTQWSIVPSPLPHGQQGGMGSITAISSNDIWTVSSTFFLHWDGTQWNYSPNPAACGSMNAVSAVSTNDVWAVGSGCQKRVSGVLIEHWDGTQWNIASDQKFKKMNATLVSVSALSANDVWAVGSTKAKVRHSVNQTLIEHWDGTRWSVIPSPDPDTNGNSLYSVIAISSNDIWAVGAATSQGTLTLNYSC